MTSDISLAAGTYYLVLQNAATNGDPSAGWDIAIGGLGPSSATSNIIGFPIYSESFQIIGSVSAAPLPAALPLFATGLGAMGLLGWWRKRKQAA